MPKFNLTPVIINLATARNKFEFWAGRANTLLISKITNLNGNLQIQLDSSSAQLYAPEIGDSFKFREMNGDTGENPEMNKLFVTNDAVSGEVEILLGYNLEIERRLRITADVVALGIRAQMIQVTDVATPLPLQSLTDRCNLLLFDADPANTIYLGNAAVSAAGPTQGMPLGPGSNIALTIGANVIIYGICGAGLTANCNILEGA